MRMSIARTLRMIVPRAVLVLAAGCQTPDLAPFAVASLELSRQVRQSGDATAQIMLAAPYHDESSRIVPPSSPFHPAREFAELWDDRLRAMDALAAYSESLATIVEESRAGQTRISELAQTVSGLGSMMPTLDRPLREGVAIGERIAKSTITVQAARSLSRATEAAHPALEGIAEILRDDVDELRLLHRKASQDLERDLNRRYGPTLDYRRALIDERDERRRALIADLAESDPAPVEELDQLIAATADDAAAHYRELASIIMERRAAERLFRALEQALDAWLDTHADIRRALEEQRQPSAVRLVILVEEIRDLTARLRELN